MTLGIRHKLEASWGPLSSNTLMSKPIFWTYTLWKVMSQCVCTHEPFKLYHTASYGSMPYNDVSHLIVSYWNGRDLTIKSTCCQTNMHDACMMRSISKEICSMFKRFQKTCVFKTSVRSLLVFASSSSTKSNWGQELGLGDKSIQVPSGSEFHQYLSATKTAPTAWSNLTRWLPSTPQEKSGLNWSMIDWNQHFWSVSLSK